MKVFKMMIIVVKIFYLKILIMIVIAIAVNSLNVEMIVKYVAKLVIYHYVVICTAAFTVIKVSEIAIVIIDKYIINMKQEKLKILIN